MNIAELFVRLSSDVSGLKKGMTAGQQSMDALKTAALKLGGVLGAAALFRGIIKNSIEAQASQAQLQAVLLSTGGAAGRSAEQLTAQADSLQAVTSYGDDAIVSAQALLLTFTKIQGTNFDRATEDILDLATAMGMDLKGATVMVGKALNDPVKGITAMTKAGVSFSAAQKDMVKHLVETGDLAGAQTLILKELEVQFGGSAKAARNTLGGALAGLSNAFGNALEVSGSASSGIVGAINTIGEVIPAVRSRIDDFFTMLQEMSINAAVNVTRLGVGWIKFKRMLALAGGTDAQVFALTKQMNDAEVQLGFMEAAAVELMAELYKVNPPLAALNKGLATTEEVSDAAAEALKKLVDEAAKITEGARIPTQIWADTIANLNTHLEAGRITQQTWYQAVAEATVALGESAKVVEEKLNPAIAEAARITESARTKTEVYRDTLIELAGHLDAGRISQETFNRSMIAAAETLAEGAKAARTFREEAQSMTLRAIDDFAAFAVGAGGSISDFVTGAMKDLARLAARMLLIAGLKAAFAGSTGGIGKFVLGAIEARASGGPVRGGQPYLVGERGPEMFVPSSSGSIVPNGGGSAAIMNMLPLARPMTPREASRDAWHREFIRHLLDDNRERG